ncbi:hypothetical protein, partial [Lactococcus petauri]|uniref:hypothetical protein n=1 Tax=Lactococcus petauri TaxID=1940789 RepID=UPI0021F1489E
MSLTTEFMIGFGFSLACAVLGVWWRLQTQITEGKEALAEFRLEVAKTYVSGEALNGLEKRLIASEERMVGAIEKLTERMDRVIDRW